MKCEKCGRQEVVCFMDLLGHVKASLCPPCLRAHGRHVRATPEFAEYDKAETELDYLHELAIAGSRPDRETWMLWQDKCIAVLGELREISERWLAEDATAEPEPAKGDRGAVLAKAVRGWTLARGHIDDELCAALAKYDAAVA